MTIELRRRNVIEMTRIVTNLEAVHLYRFYLQLGRVNETNNIQFHIYNQVE